MHSTADTIVLVPGLRGHVRDHWQTRLEATLPNAISVPGLGSSYPSLDDRVALLNRVIEDVDGPVTIVAHSAGVLTTVHWAARCYPGSSPGRRPGGAITGALLVTPPDLVSPLPAPYPSRAELQANGWFPIPAHRLPFASIVAASTNDALGDHEQVRALANAWGSRFRSLGPVGHLNPASGYGDWPAAAALLDELAGLLVA